MQHTSRDPGTHEARFANLDIDGRMKIHLLPDPANPALFVLEIFVKPTPLANYAKTYLQSGLSIADLSDLRLQSHWGSGVTFSNVDIDE